MTENEKRVAFVREYAALKDAQALHAGYDIIYLGPESRPENRTPRPDVCESAGACCYREPDESRCVRCGKARA